MQFIHVLATQPTLSITALAVLGLLIGSFLNVVIHRLPQEDPAKRSLLGRSKCPQCQKAIAWWDNVPVFGWLLLRGRSRCCKQRIAIRYPLVELVTIEDLQDEAAARAPASRSFAIHVGAAAASSSGSSPTSCAECRGRTRNGPFKAPP